MFSTPRRPRPVREHGGAAHEAARARQMLRVRAERPSSTRDREQAGALDRFAGAMLGWMPANRELALGFDHRRVHPRGLRSGMKRSLTYTLGSYDRCCSLRYEPSQPASHSRAQRGAGPGTHQRPRGAAADGVSHPTGHRHLQAQRPGHAAASHGQHPGNHQGEGVVRRKLLQRTQSGFEHGVGTSVCAKSEKGCLLRILPQGDACTG